MSADTDTERSVGFAYLLLLTTIVAWASAFSALKFVLVEIDPYALTTLRLLIAASTVAVTAVLFGVPLPEKRDAPWIVATGLLGFTIYHMSLNFGLSFDDVGAGQGSFIISTTPIWTTLIAWRFLEEHAGYRTWIGLSLGLTGVGWMSLDPEQLSLSVGSLIVLFAALCNACQIVLQKRLLERYRPFHLAIYLTFIGSLPMVGYLPWIIDSATGMSGSAWAATLYLGIVPVPLGYFANAIVLSIIDASRMSQALLLIPPLATLVAWLTLAEVPSTQLYIGGPLILLGVLLGQLDRSGRRATPRDERPETTG